MKKSIGNYLLIIVELTIAINYDLLCVDAVFSEGTLNEYCLAETFNPTCKQDEVILIQSASYGQMKIGSCIDRDYGFLWCTSNQLVNLDSICSGKQMCSVVVEDSVMTEKINCSIPKTLTRYLEAKYHCVKVYQASSEECKESKKLSLKSGKLTIASITTQTAGCGLENKPWVLEAKPGQKVNVSLTDFKWNSKVSSLVKCPVRYGYIIDVGINQLVDICGGTNRQKHVYLSEGSSLQIIIDSHLTEETRFLLSFEVVGCPKFNSPKDTWTRVDGNVITVGCMNNEDMWKMRCIGNHWIGIVGSCQKVVSRSEVDTDVTHTDYSIFGMTPVVGYSLIGAMFLVILCVALTSIIGYFCIRKKKSPSKGYLAPVHYPTNTAVPLNMYPSYRSGGNIGGHNVHTMLINDPSRLRMGGDNNDLIQNSSTPQYFVLENREEEQKDDAVYQNIGDINSV